MFDFTVSAAPNADGSLTGTCAVTKNGAPFVTYTATYYGLSAADVQELQQFATDTMAQVTHKGLKNQGQMHATQRKLINRLMEFGDSKIHGK